MPAIAWAGLHSGNPLPSLEIPDSTDIPAEHLEKLQTQLLPFLEGYCLGCHKGEKAKADVRLDAALEADYFKTHGFQRHRKVWERALFMLREGKMPPEKRRAPEAAERSAAIAWLEAELNRFDCSAPIDPGHVTIRRLNRSEYRNTIRDLLGVDYQAAADFPSDEVGYGFDNIGDVLSLPPLLMEKYLAAAEEIIGAAVAADAERYFLRRFEAEAQTVEADHSAFENWALSINKEGEVRAVCELPSTGEYVLRARSWGQQAGPEPPRLALRIDGRQVFEAAVPAGIDSPQINSTQLPLGAGRRRISVAYLNNYVNNNHPDPKLRGDRNLIVDWFEIEAIAVEGEDRAVPKLFPCRPLQPREIESCARRNLQAFVRRAYRRPPLDEEVERLLDLFLSQASAGESFESALSTAYQAVLASPHFLFRVEPPSTGRAQESGAAGEKAAESSAAPAQAAPIGDFALASRLSYFIWGSMPDEPLFQAAENGELAADSGLTAQVLRMLADPRSRSLVENFAGQWLQLRFLNSLNFDADLFPGVDAALLEDMATETKLYFEAVLREGRSLIELIDGDFTFVNERLARHYGIEGVAGGDFQRVSLERSARGGILTQASVLALTSNPTRTSPVKRGKWILEQILGEPPPPPPPNVEQLNESPEAILSGSLRRRMEMHRRDPHCSVCHERMDQLGFAFENFDAVGRWRDFDGKFLIDPAGTLPDGSVIDGVEGLKKVLTAAADPFAACLSEKMLTFALGRGLEYYDRCAVERIVERLRTQGYRLRDLVVAVALSEPFRMQRIRT